MGDFPASHTTATAATTTQDTKKIYVNSSYLKNTHGILKACHMVVCLLIFICTMVSDYPRSDRANWLSFVSMGGFWTSAVLLFLYVINVVTYLKIIPWVKLELAYSVLWAFFCFVAGCVAADGATNGYGEAFAAAAFFCFVAMCVYGFTAFLHYRLWREGIRLFTTSTTIVSSVTTTTSSTTTTTQTSRVSSGSAPPQRY